MHEVIIYPFKVQSKTKAMNAELKRYGENVNKEYRVMEEIMETSPDLAGRAWDSARNSGIMHKYPCRQSKNPRNRKFDCYKINTK